MIGDQKKCRVLSVSGGGAKGAYEVGAIHELVNTFEFPDSHYDVISGVSVGSINAAGAGLFGKGEDKEMGEFLKSMWYNLTNDQVYRMWNPLNPIAGITEKAGFLDNTPFHDFLIRILKEKGTEYKKRVLVSANDA